MVDRKIHKDYKPLIEAAKAAGWTLEPGFDGKGHLRIKPPEGWTHDGGGGRSISIAATASDRRTLLNTRARMRRAGIPC